jgi:hypothetical protein
MSLERRQAEALSILEKLQQEQATTGEWVWGLLAAGLAVVAVWLCRFW